MQLDISGILAKCFSCGSTDFEPLRPTPAGPSDRLACARCSTEVCYQDLLSQTCRAAIETRNAVSALSRRAKESLDHE